MCFKTVIRDIGFHLTSKVVANFVVYNHYHFIFISRQCASNVPSRSFAAKSAKLISSLDTLSLDT